jgi:hypothetical protein
MIIGTKHTEVTMSNNKQSSVEWLITQLQKSKDFQRVLNEVSQMSTAKIDILSEAKEMHKEEMIEFANDFWTETDSTLEYTNAEIFYNKMFKSE